MISSWKVFSFMEKVSVSIEKKKIASWIRIRIQSADLDPPENQLVGKIKICYRPMSDQHWKIFFLIVFIYTCGVWIHDIWKAWISVAWLSGEVVWFWVFFFCALYLQILMLQLFPPISHLIRHHRPAVYLSLLTPAILRYSDLVKLRATAGKSLWQEMSRRSTMTGPWWGCRYKHLWKRQRRRNGSGEAEKSHPDGFHQWYRCWTGEWLARECQETRWGP